MKVYVATSQTVIAFVRDCDATFVEILPETQTVNVVEHLAITKIVKRFFNCNLLEIYSDNRLVVDQLNGRWCFEEVELRKLTQLVWSLVSGMQRNGNCVMFMWIPLEDNPARRLLADRRGDGY